MALKEERDMNIKHRIEVLWGWVSLLVLLVCWDAALRLDSQVSERVHLGERATHRQWRRLDAFAKDQALEAQGVASRHALH